MKVSFYVREWNDDGDFAVTPVNSLYHGISYLKTLSYHSREGEIGLLTKQGDWIPVTP